MGGCCRQQQWRESCFSKSILLEDKPAGETAESLCVWEQQWAGIWCLQRLLMVMFVEGGIHTPSIAFWHLSPDSARIGYFTEGALFISAQLSDDAFSTLQKVWMS